MEIIIKQATTYDVVELYKIIENTIKDSPYYNDLAKAGEIAKYRLAGLLDKIATDKHSILVAKKDDKIIGFLLSKIDDCLIWAEWLGIVDEYRGMGLANLLMLELEKTALIRNCHKIWCDCRTINKASIHILTKHGYKEIVTVPNFWYNQDFILWEKEIKTMNKEDILKDLFYNKLSLDNSMKDLVIKIMYPYTNYADYIKYGNMFISLKLIDQQTK